MLRADEALYALGCTTRGMQGGVVSGAFLAHYGLLSLIINTVLARLPKGRFRLSALEARRLLDITAMIGTSDMGHPATAI